MTVRSPSAAHFLLTATMLVTVGLASSGCSWGQEPNKGKAAAADLREEAKENQTAKENRGDPSALASATSAGRVDETPLATLPAAEAASTAELTKTTELTKTAELTERVVALQTEVDALRATVAALNQALVNLQDPRELSRNALGAMSEDADLRAGLGQMLQGKIRLVNDTGSPEVVYINGTAWTVVTGESYIFSPVGTVSLQRAGYEEPTFMGIQEWYENKQTGQFELEYHLPAVGDAAKNDVTEVSVLKRVVQPS